MLVSYVINVLKTHFKADCLKKGANYGREQFKKNSSFQ